MRRREFLAAIATAMVSARGGTWSSGAEGNDVCCDRTYASPQEAMRSDPERLLYATGIYTGTATRRPDFLATVDVDPKSPTYSQVVHRLPMPYVGDELHHFGWNFCSSCHGQPGISRRYLIVPGLRSGRIHVIDTVDPSQPLLHKVIEPSEVMGKTNLSAPHTVHCLADGTIMISMLGDRHGNGPGGFLLLDQEFNIAGRWEEQTGQMRYNYDFWYQPRHNVMVSSEWAAPKTFQPGFDLQDVESGRYGRQLHFWDWTERVPAKTIDLGEGGMIPLEVRFHHNPDSPHGFVGAALSSALWHWHRPGGDWEVEKVVQVDPVEVDGWPFPVPGLITDLLISMDDRWLYFSNWLHGDVRQYDISDPSTPKLAGRYWCGGLLGKGEKIRGRQLAGGPQMLQLSLDGRRLYVTNSLYSTWDNQFYPKIAEEGSWMLQLNCDTQRGGLELNEDFFVDFGQEPHGPARAHEMRFPHGDSTSDIWT